MRNTLQMKKWYVKWTGEGREWWKGPACDLNKTGYKSSWLSYSQFPYLEILQIYLCYVSLGMIPMVTVDMDYLRWLCGWQTPFRQWDIGVFSHKIIVLGYSGYFIDLNRNSHWSPQIKYTAFSLSSLPQNLSQEKIKLVWKPMFYKAMLDLPSISCLCK